MKSEGATPELERRCKSMLKKNPEMSSLVAYTAIVNDLGGIPVIDECVEQYMLNEPTLGEFVELQQLSEAAKDRMMRRLQKFAAHSPNSRATRRDTNARSVVFPVSGCCGSARAAATGKRNGQHRGCSSTRCLQHSITKPLSHFKETQPFC